MGTEVKNGKVLRMRIPCQVLLKDFVFNVLTGTLRGLFSELKRR